MNHISLYQIFSGQPPLTEQLCIRLGLIGEWKATPLSGYSIKSISLLGLPLDALTHVKPLFHLPFRATVISPPTCLSIQLQVIRVYRGIKQAFRGSVQSVNV